jgi:hypothetical protein
MGIIVVCFKEIQFVTRFKFIALPATIYTFLLATISHLAEGRATPGAAGLAAELDHHSQHLVALRVVLVRLEEGYPGKAFGSLSKFRLAQLFAQVSCQIGYLLPVTKAVTAVEAAVGD